jgi:hypothetical protein
VFASAIVFVSVPMIVAALVNRNDAVIVIDAVNDGSPKRVDP